MKRATSLLEVVSRYVELKRAGDGRWRGCCPFHAEKTPSFHVREDRQKWHCFGCAEGGDVLDFVQRAERISLKEAMVRLGSMDISASPVPLWAPPKKQWVIPCVARGCGERIEVDTKDIPYLGEQLFSNWKFRGDYLTDNESFRALCPRCCLQARRYGLAARRNSADSQAAPEVTGATATRGSRYRAWGPVGHVAPG